MSKENRKITQKALKLLKKHLGLEINDNAKFTEDDHIRILAHALIQNVSLEESSAQLNTLTKAPSPDVTQYHFKKKEVKILEQELDSLLKENLTTLRKRRTLKKPRDVAIDFHNVSWYGKYKPWIVGGKHKQGTSYFVQFATLEIVEKGERLCIKATPVTQFKSKEQAVKELLGFAQDAGIRIMRLYLDRAFPTTEVIKVLGKFKVRWIAAFSKNDRVKEAIRDAHQNGGFVRWYEMGQKNNKVSFNLVLVKNKKYHKPGTDVIDWYSAFATNLDVKEDEREDLSESYRRRWGIETGYRVKREFRIRTSTRVYSMKVLFFFLSVAMYNLWVLLNLEALEDFPYLESPLITIDRMKFYYQLEFFCPDILEKDEENALLHRRWVENGFVPAKIAVLG